MKRTRRKVIGATAGVVVLAAAGAGYEVWRGFGKRYPPTPYDDLLSLLPDREGARQVGRAFLATNSGFMPAYAATALRQHIGHRSLMAVLNDEISTGQLAEAGHWLLPQTFVGLCALAAKS
jgi:hypothetical protein